LYRHGAGALGRPSTGYDGADQGVVVGCARSNSGQSRTGWGGYLPSRGQWMKTDPRAEVT
jgi:hypothetical protein